MMELEKSMMACSRFAGRGFASSFIAAASLLTGHIGLAGCASSPPTAKEVSRARSGETLVSDMVRMMLDSSAVQAAVSESPGSPLPVEAVRGAIVGGFSSNEQISAIKAFEAELHAAMNQTGVFEVVSTSETADSGGAILAIECSSRTRWVAGAWAVTHRVTLRRRVDGRMLWRGTCTVNSPHAQAR